MKQPHFKIKRQSILAVILLMTAVLCHSDRDNRKIAPAYRFYLHPVYDQDAMMHIRWENN